MYSIFLELLKDHNVKTSEVARATGISNATFSDWKKGRSVPKADKMKLIADFFGVPVDYLTTGSSSLVLSNREQDLLSRFRSLNLLGQDKILEYLDDISCSEKYQAKNESLSRSAG